MTSSGCHSLDITGRKITAWLVVIVDCRLARLQNLLSGVCLFICFIEAFLELTPLSLRSQLHSTESYISILRYA